MGPVHRKGVETTGEVDPAQAEGKRKFGIDYSKRGTAKCAKCKINIPKGDLRLGKCSF